MKRGNIINIVLSLTFIFMVSTFIFIPTKQNTTVAAPVAKCSLLYDIGCNVYYCWAARFNNTDCRPCGSVGGCY